MSNTNEIPLTVLRRAALDAGVHEKTALRAVEGLPVRPAGRERLLEALARQGIDVSKLRNAKFGAIAAGARTDHNQTGGSR